MSASGKAVTLSPPLILIDMSYIQMVTFKNKDVTLTTRQAKFVR